MNIYNLTFVFNKKETDMEIEASSLESAMRKIVAKCCPKLAKKMWAVRVVQRELGTVCWDVCVSAAGSTRVGYDGHVKYFGN